jgi:hypothetical protein
MASFAGIKGYQEGRLVIFDHSLLHMAGPKPQWSSFRFI